MKVARKPKPIVAENVKVKWFDPRHDTQYLAAEGSAAGLVHNFQSFSQNYKVRDSALFLTSLDVFFYSAGPWWRGREGGGANTLGREVTPRCQIPLYVLGDKGGFQPA